MAQTAVVEGRSRPHRESFSRRLSPVEREDLIRRFSREAQLRQALLGDELSAEERGRLEFELMEVSPYVAEALRLNFKEGDPADTALSEREKLDRLKQDARRLVDSLALADTLRERIEIYRAYGRSPRVRRSLRTQRLLRRADAGAHRSVVRSTLLEGVRKLNELVAEGDAFCEVHAQRSARVCLQALHAHSLGDLDRGGIFVALPFHCPSSLASVAASTSPSK